MSRGYRLNLYDILKALNKNFECRDAIISAAVTDQNDVRKEFEAAL